VVPVEPQKGHPKEREEGARGGGLTRGGCNNKFSSSEGLEALHHEGVRF
jgi:hypothetical protein